MAQRPTSCRRQSPVKPRVECVRTCMHESRNSVPHGLARANSRNRQGKAHPTGCDRTQNRDQQPRHRMKESARCSCRETGLPSGAWRTGHKRDIFQTAPTPTGQAQVFKHVHRSHMDMHGNRSHGHDSAPRPRRAKTGSLLTETHNQNHGPGMKAIIAQPLLPHMGMTYFPGQDWASCVHREPRPWHGEQSAPPNPAWGCVNVESLRRAIPGCPTSQPSAAWGLNPGPGSGVRNDGKVVPAL